MLLDHGKGTGKTFDWSILKAVPDHRYFLAGGLGTENIKEAIQIYHPAVIDLSSSVETDGKKRPEKNTGSSKSSAGYRENNIETREQKKIKKKELKNDKRKIWDSWRTVYS